MDTKTSKTSSSEKTLSGYLQQSYDNLGHEIKEIQEVYDALFTEVNHINGVIGKLRDVMYNVPMMPNNPNIIQEATKQLEREKKRRGNLAYAIMSIHGMDNEKLELIENAEWAGDINEVMSEVLGQNRPKD